VLGGSLLRDVFFGWNAVVWLRRGGGGGVQSSGSRFTVSSLPFPTSSKVLSPFLFAKLEYHPFARSGSSLQYRSALAKGKVVSVRVR